MLIEYKYQLLSRTGQDLGPLAGVRRGSGQTTFSAASSVKSSASIVLENTGQIESWLDVRIQPWVSVDGDEWPLGVFIPDVPERAFNNLGETAQVNLLDKLSILDGDSFGETFGAPAGTVVTEAVRDIIDSTGEPAGAITDSDAALLTAIEWEPQDSKLKIVNDMLDAATFFSLWTDGRGNFQVTPWDRPARRPVRAEYVDGEDGVHVVNPLAGAYAPDFTARHDVGKIPNVYIAISQGDGDEEALRSEAINTNPDDPYSRPRRGYRKLPENGVEMNVKTTSQAALDEHAARRLIELSEPQETVTIRHRPGRTRINDAVRFTSRTYGIEGLFTVQRQEWVHAFDGLVTSTLRRVVDI